jgi:phage-related protein (TIGR01555 family)
MAPMPRKRSAPVVPAPVPAAHTDGAYLNVFASVGNSRDRAAATRATAPLKLDQTSLEWLYTGDGFARKIVDMPANEMVRAGYDIEGIEDDDAVKSTLEDINAIPLIAKALRWAGLYGGALIVALIDDGAADLTEPLNVNRIRGIDQLRVYDRWQVSRMEKYTDPADKRFGQTKIYNISPLVGTPYWVHESRCIPVDGMDVPDRVRDENDGWGGSRLQQCWDQLNRFNLSHHWANSLLERAQQAVHGIPNLTDVLRSPNGETMVRARINAVDMARSVNNTIVIDAAESYDLKSTSLSGVSDIIDRFSLALSAVTGMPEAILFGRAPGGLNSTGKADLENWYAGIMQQQETVLMPVLDQLIAWTLYAQGRYTPDYQVEFEPLSVPSEKEVTETRLAQAKIHEIYVNMQALDPSEVRRELGSDVAEVEGDVEIDMGEDDGAEAE